MIEIGTGILVSIVGTLILIWYRKGKNQLDERSANQKIQKSLNSRLYDSGFTDFYASRTDRAKHRKEEKLIDYLGEAKSEIVLVSYWLAQASELEGFAEKLVSFCSSPKCIRVTIAMINPDSPVLKQVAEFLDMSAEDARLRIQASLKSIYDAKMKLKTGDRNRLSIRVFDGFPTVSIFMIDPSLEHGRIHADFKLFRAPRNESFMFELSGNQKKCYINMREAAFAQIEVANEFGPRTHLKGFQLATTKQREMGK